MTGGRLVLVVGPSGAGKDTLIRRAEAGLRSEARYRFPRRYVTRPAGDPHEDHIALTDEEFRARERAGQFSLVWRAHGLGYALPRTVDCLVADGRIVVANVSRTVVGQARSRFARIGVIQVTASRGTLALRLAGRGRESGEESARRLARPAPALPDGPDVRTLVNEGPLEEAAAAFVGLLRALAA
ncbi:MAG: phosphonate metabolism protein/1,5-bisphosphokinase (PRPP-forming) PhnN [Alphaproteobacteria bacterium]|nr:phosphonate metabolism protein/1,5-bisphosphokinase (PRPP-forming) PhnN [Alphaproteobacteria bacterium]